MFGKRTPTTTPTDPTSQFFADLKIGDVFVVTGTTGRQSCYQADGQVIITGVHIRWISGPTVFTSTWMGRDADTLAPRIVYENPYERGLK